MLGWLKGRKSKKNKDIPDLPKDDSNLELDPEDRVEDFDKILEKEEIIDSKNFVIQKEDLYKGFWDPTLDELEAFLSKFEF